MKDEDRLSAALGRLPQAERPAWINEANRLARIIEHYARLRPKRRRHPLTSHYEFVPDAMALCQQAACRDPVILGREPHTLDDWRRAFRRDGQAGRSVGAFAQRSDGETGRRPIGCFMLSTRAA